MSGGEYVLLSVGIAVYVLTMWDVLKTTLSMHGGGPLTTVLTSVADRFLFAPPAKLGVHTSDEPVARFFARYSNLLLTTSLFFTWVLGLLLGPTLVLLSADGALTGGSLATAELVDRAYYIGATLTTAGLGAWRASSGVWQVVTVITAVSGIVVTSLGISYVINLVSAVTAQRRIARQITNLGKSPRSILSAHYDGQGFTRFGSNCASLAKDILGHTERHLAYPMIHYVRASENRDCLPAAIALLDETLSILIFNVPAARRPAGDNLLTLRRAVSTYLESLRSIYLSDGRAECPPYPDVTWTLDLWGFHADHRERHLDDEETAALRERRTLLRAAVQSQGLAWETYQDAIDHESTPLLDVKLLPLLANEERQRI